MQIAERVIVITGAASGVGAAAARRFATERAKLVLTDMNDGPLQALAGELGAAALAGDICAEATVEQVAAHARERHGRIDIWFSNAGFAGKAGRSVAPTQDYRLRKLTRIVALPNCSGAVCDVSQRQVRACSQPFIVERRLLEPAVRSVARGAIGTAWFGTFQPFLTMVANEGSWH